jgi:hypothetical protein
VSFCTGCVIVNKAFSVSIIGRSNVMHNLSFSFNIAAWHAVSSRMAAPAQWQAWAADADAALEMPDYKPALAFLPAMQRRRLGDSARRVLDAAWDLAADYPDAPLVYVSHDGEINRSFELWLGLLRDNEVSPTSFGLSVHNALAGQWSMLRGDMGENTALAVRATAWRAAWPRLMRCFMMGQSRCCWCWRTSLERGL